MMAEMLAPRDGSINVSKTPTRALRRSEPRRSHHVPRATDPRCVQPGLAEAA